jgi:hypothetical protein
MTESPIAPWNQRQRRVRWPAAGLRLRQGCPSSARSRRPGHRDRAGQMSARNRFGPARANLWPPKPTHAKGQPAKERRRRAKRRESQSWCSHPRQLHDGVGVVSESATTEAGDTSGSIGEAFDKSEGRCWCVQRTGEQTR